MRGPAIVQRVENDWEFLRNPNSFRNLNLRSCAVHAQPATTLIFKDGKPSTQVHNYVLTSSTLYELDEGTSLEIPISEIDLPATIAANRAACSRVTSEACVW